MFSAGIGIEVLPSHFSSARRFDGRQTFRRQDQDGEDDLARGSRSAENGHLAGDANSF
jgi:hypothetical protein